MESCWGHGSPGLGIVLTGCQLGRARQAEFRQSCDGICRCLGPPRLCLSLLGALGPPGPWSPVRAGMQIPQADILTNQVRLQKQASTGCSWVTQRSCFGCRCFYQVLRHCYIKGCFFPVGHVIPLGDQKVPSISRV